MTDEYNERIRRGLAVLVEDSPLAPEFDELTTTHVRPIETRRAKPVAVAGLSAAAVLATFVVGAIWLGEPGGSPELGGEAPPAPADSPSTTLVDLPPGEFPGIVLDAPDWSIAYIDYSDGLTSDGKHATSDLQFNNGSTEAELRMTSGSEVDSDGLIEDRESSGTRLADQPIWDTTAAVVGEGASSFTAVWESNAVEYEFVVNNIDEGTFRSLLSSLTQMTEEEWIAALPDEIVTNRAEVIPTFLEDVPLPPNFDTTSLEEGPIEHWYGVAADTVSAVSCAWIEVWIDAKATGDTEAVQRAVDAMDTSHDWQVLDDMTTVGDYPNVVWEYAEAIAGDGTIVAGTILTVEASYQRALGCSS